MRRRNTDVIMGIWKQLWFAAVILYISYFLYRWIGVYISQILGQISDQLLYQNIEFNDFGLIGKFIAAFFISLIIMPSQLCHDKSFAYYNKFLLT